MSNIDILFILLYTYDMYNVYSIGSFDINSLPNTKTKQYWEFVLIMDGHCVYRGADSDMDILLSKGDVLAVPPSSVYKILCKAEELDARYIRLTEVNMPSNAFKVEKVPNSLFHHLFLHLEYFCDDQLYLRTSIVESLAEVFINSIMEYGNILNFSPAVEKVYMAIQRHFNDAEFNIKDILQQKHKHHNYDYLRRTFKKEVGISPTHLVRKLQIEHSIKLIDMHKGLPCNIHKIAISCGINDSYYFSRLFKLQIGISPQQYLYKIGATYINTQIRDEDIKSAKLSLVE